MNLEISGKTALVLGGGKGIGRGISEALEAEGARVVLTARKPEDARTAAEEIGGDTVGLSCDTSDAASVAALADTVEQTFGGVDILVLNSGGPAPGAASDMPVDAYRKAFEQLFAGPVELALRLLPGMRDRGYGRIMTVGSSGLIEPIANLAVSNAVRASIAGWSKTLAREVAAEGVTVNILVPGRIDTERVGQLDAAAAKRTRQDIDTVRTQSRARIPAGRYGRISEFGAVAAFLASPQAAFVTGSMIRIDGGQITAL